jgi:hypothetical protein
MTFSNVTRVKKLSPPYKAGYQRYSKQGKSDPEQNSSTLHCGTSNATETKKRRNERDDEKDYRIVQ